MSCYRTIYPEQGIFIVKGRLVDAFIEDIEIKVELSDSFRWDKQKQFLREAKLLALEEDILQLMNKYFDTEHIAIDDEVKRDF